MWTDHEIRYLLWLKFIQNVLLRRFLYSSSLLESSHLIGWSSFGLLLFLLSFSGVRVVFFFNFIFDYFKLITLVFNLSIISHAIKIQSMRVPNTTALCYMCEMDSNEWKKGRFFFVYVQYEATKITIDLSSIDLSTLICFIFTVLLLCFLPVTADVHSTLSLHVWLMISINVH